MVVSLVLFTSLGSPTREARIGLGEEVVAAGGHVCRDRHARRAGRGAARRQRTYRARFERRIRSVEQDIDGQEESRGGRRRAAASLVQRGIRDQNRSSRRRLRGRGQGRHDEIGSDRQRQHSSVVDLVRLGDCQGSVRLRKEIVGARGERIRQEQRDCAGARRAGGKLADGTAAEQRIGGFEQQVTRQVERRLRRRGRGPFPGCACSRSPEWWCRRRLAPLPSAR